jgi:signal peptidase II
MKLTRTRWIAAAIVGVVAADWTTKFLVHNHLYLGSVRPVLDGWVWLAHRNNRGVSFSALADLDTPWRTPLLAVLALLGVGVAVHILRATRDPWVRGAAALVIAGALGNLGDRLLDGGVTDFILLRWFPFVFNVADVAITFGAVLLMLRLGLAADHAEPGPAAPTPS